METLRKRLEAGTFDASLAQLYGAQAMGSARVRVSSVLDAFVDTFHALPEAVYSAPGRTELGGNHTDHQHGCVLAAAVDLDLIAAVTPNRSGMIRVQSEGYPLVEVNLAELAPKEGEENTTAALIRGVAARMAALGCPLQEAGAEVYVVSNVPAGSGLSSSAAFEVLMGTVLNDLFWGGSCTPVKIARVGQYAENVYFGKPSGLMDQTASAVGGVVAIDFADPTTPLVEQIPLNLRAAGYALCILDSGADHADLTQEYAAITRELKAVCRVFGKEVLREVAEEEFFAALPAVRQAAGDRAALRAIHVFAENRRAVEEAEALRRGDFEAFLSLVRESGRSSAMYLQNLVPAGQATHQELPMSIALCEKILAGRGAVRVHGGGFGGTVQAFVPLELLDTFQLQTEAVLGKGSCRVVTVRPVGGICLQRIEK